MQDWTSFSVELSDIGNTLASLSRSSTTPILATVVSQRPGISGSTTCSPLRPITFIGPRSKLYRHLIINMAAAGPVLITEGSRRNSTNIVW